MAISAEGKQAIKSAHKGHGAAKVEKVIHEFKHGELHSGSKHGPDVTSRKQALAIAMSEAGLSRKH
jgi:hypothetical protein